MYNQTNTPEEEALEEAGCALHPGGCNEAALEAGLKAGLSMADAMDMAETDDAAMMGALEAEALTNSAVSPGTSTATNSVPTSVVRVIPGSAVYPTLGPPGNSDVFVTVPSAIAGMTPAQIAHALTIPQSDTFTILEFPTPTVGIASPVFRNDPGFIPGGLTAGGAPEFVIPNGPVPSTATIITVGHGK